ncbi:MAG: hypothetical protein NT040_13365 [Bacteroidetes bacterium]|nr:hypothetical protein [Bacteroidota bacterium]
MKTKEGVKHLSGWQLFISSGSEFDYNLENDGSEDEEYNFYSFTGNDYKDTEMEKRE